ncbi:hypothetical protein Ctha_0897 [Chloroherpeton thalassium ATCC 35110]|uniref:Tll0287-like domain-containing protein n=1 Tax=Chloroherpeton thalassium (strain ATCC 35110 / GB-78) TaxID=517418 RepID=B3QX00_CHLT3|nr:DUF3365 domain-containing protein [Chloroherpeton thalassium]ACF13364.1 hypothetical protein Ctha_0897 [Chloroherpeton thalassium ATCC 35110]
MAQSRKASHPGNKGKTETPQPFDQEGLSHQYTTQLTAAIGEDLVKLFALIGVSWSAIILCLALWGVASQLNETDKMTLYQTRLCFQQIVITRLWNAEHGGVYALVTDTTPPNPYLKIPNRDVTTTDGQKLTMINPAYMTRQISEMAAQRNHFQFHITSLNPLRPENAPYDWEIKALRSFSKKQNEYYSWVEDSTGEYSAFRYMAPLWTEKPCLKCHEEQGYQIGDIRGGISVSIPADSIMTYRNSHIGTIIATHFSILILGLFGISVAFLYARQDQFELRRLILKTAPRAERSQNAQRVNSNLLALQKHPNRSRLLGKNREVFERKLRCDLHARHLS